MFRPLEAKLILLVWIFLVTKCINACQNNKVYKLDEYDCTCATPATGRRWYMNCFSKVSSEDRKDGSAISSTTDATQTGLNPLTNTTENTGRTGSIPEPRNRTQRVHSTKLSSGGSIGVQKLPRVSRETSMREVDFIGKNRETLVFTIEYEPSAEKGGAAYLDILCHEGGIEKERLVEKLEVFHVRDVVDMKFRNCALPKSVTYAQILGIAKNKISKFSLISPKLESSILPKKPFENYARFIHELSIIETKNRESPALSDFEEGFFEAFSNLTFLSLSRNNVLSTKALELLSNLKELNLSGNPFTNLAADAFQNLTRLARLDLSDCVIQSIDKDAFADLVDLQTLELVRNYLTQLPPELFRATVKLETLALDLNNFTRGFPENSFENLKKLTTFTCKLCGIRELRPQTFQSMTMLHKLDLSINGISNLDENIFSDLVRLRELHLSRNALTDIEGLVLPPLLEILDLKHNRLRSFPENLLNATLNIISIDLTNNSIESLKSKTFSTATQLETLNLSENLLSNFGLLLSSHLIKIKSINLSHNRLTSLPLIFTHSITGLEKLDVSHNKIQSVRMQTFRSNKLEIDLRQNPLETIDVSDLKPNYNMTESSNESIVYIINDPLKCDCNLLEFYEYYKFHKKPWFGDFSLTPQCRDRRRDQPRSLDDQVKENFRCPLNETQGCPSRCSCDLAAVNQRVRVNCSGLNLTTATLPQLPTNITELTLANNRFEDVPVFKEYRLLEKIDLSNNRIIDTSGLTAQPTEMWKQVSLANNSISELENIRKENYTLDLTGNRFVCNCATWKVLNEFFKAIDLRDKKDIECSTSVDQGYLRLIHFLEDDSCLLRDQKAFTRLVVALTFFAALLIVLLVVVYYKNQRRIIVYMYNYHYNIYLFFWPVHEIENDKMYDAFVSFSDHDVSLVNEMMNELEKTDPITGEKTYKLCRHDRDWIPGNSITYNIAHSVQNSCRTILVLSENFLKSAWLNTELKTALVQMVSDKSHKLIIIVLGELPPEKKLDVELRGLLENTYLKWSNPRFWDHLRYLLPHKKQKNKGIDKTKAVLNNYGQPMTKILSLENKPTPANVARTAEILENEKNRLKSIAQMNGGSSNGQINEAYVAISTEDISVHCDSFKDANKPSVASGRHRPSSDSAVRPPRKKDKHVSEA